MNILSAIYKELLVLTRDRAGLAVLYIMPLTLIILMALIQDAPFRDYKDTHIPVLFVDQDNGQLSALISEKLSEAGMFSLVRADSSHVANEKYIQLVADGSYKAAIVVKDKASSHFDRKLRIRIEKSFNSFAAVKSAYPDPLPADDDIQIVWDPVIKKSFKDGLTTALNSILIGYQADKTLAMVEDRLRRMSGDDKLTMSNTLLIEIKQRETSEPDHALYALNSVQHNVPAWAIFGIFFMVIPLAGNIIREREQKTMLRLHLIPGSIQVVLLGKILTYLFVAVTQFVLVVLAGKYLMPVLGLPALYTGDNWAAISLVVMALGLAAAGYGVFVGTLFNTTYQASTFGAVSIVILAAIGGIWIPIFIMPEIVQKLSLLSPLSWGMKAFNTIFLRGSGIEAVYWEILLLSGFAIVMFAGSFLWEKNKN